MDLQDNLGFPGGMIPAGGSMDGSHGMNGAARLPSKSSSAPKFKKAPDAPKRFKSAFIIFSAEKHKVIKEELAKEGRAEKTTDIAKMVSEAWRELNPEEKEVWETKARKDKARYEVEKAMYKGPWKVPANKRTPKDPTAPKRPMSAFLAFSNKRRAALKRQHPDATNADLSRMLSKTWKEAPDDLRRKYMDEEKELRDTYKVEMAKWRKKVAEEKKAERKEREAVAMQTAENRANEQAARSSQNPGMGGDPTMQGAPDMNMNGMYAAAAGGGYGYPPQQPPGMGGDMGYPMQPQVGQGNPGNQPYPNMQGGFTTPQQQQQQLLQQLLASQQMGRMAMPPYGGQYNGNQPGFAPPMGQGMNGGGEYVGMPPQMGGMIKDDNGGQRAENNSPSEEGGNDGLPFEQQNFAPPEYTGRGSQDSEDFDRESAL